MALYNMVNNNELSEKQLSNVIGGINDVEIFLQQQRLAYLDNRAKRVEGLNTVHNSSLDSTPRSDLPTR